MKTDEEQPECVTESQEALEMLGKGYNNDPIPSTQFISTLTGVTPVPDYLIHEYGYVTALVWGMVRRYCQMADGVCRAATDKIGARLGMSAKTITRHLDKLCEGGYLFDMTPDLRNKPHIYTDTGKITLKMSFEATRTESPSDYDSKSHEESTTNRGEVQKNIFTHYEKCIGGIYPPIADALEDAEKTYPVAWILESMDLAVVNNKRNWRYCEVILRRWKESGKDEGKGKSEIKTTIPADYIPEIIKAVPMPEKFKKRATQ